MSNRAWVTLATNDSYGLGALVVAHSLRRSGSTYPAVVLITPSVTEAMRERLRAVFAEVVVVDVLDSRDAAHLALLQRPELGITFTKIHCWNLTQYEKCVFLDADTLIVQNCDELFEREELSAAPDVGWPDCFNSGVFVFRPSAETFSNLITFASERGSFDGGDQGLLNAYFSDWAHGDINKHLPFLYNVTSAAFYSYIPALKHYGQNLKIIHFIGAGKPWLQQFNWQTRSVGAPQHLQGFLQLWWDLFVGQVHSQLETSMGEVVEDPLEIVQEETANYNECQLPVNYSYYEPTLDTDSEFPWHHPDKQDLDIEQSEPAIDMSQFYDPWDIYRGNIPASKSDIQQKEQTADDYQDMRKYAWDYSHPQNNKYHTDGHYEQVLHDNNFDVQSHNDHHIAENQEAGWQSNTESSQYQHFATNFQQHSQHINQQYDTDSAPTLIASHSVQHVDKHTEPHHPHQDHYNHLNTPQDSKNVDIAPENDSQIGYHICHTHDTHILQDQEKHMNKKNTCFSQHKKRKNPQQVYTVMMDHVKLNHHIPEEKVNGYESDSDSDIYEEITPRHPYDGFYLRHRMTIDSRGHKVCSHEIPLRPPSPASESLDEFEDALETLTEEITDKALKGQDSQTGVAGNLARVVPGAPLQQEAVDELTRRQGWEAGNMDYMGADSFDNIWAKISQTLNEPPNSTPEQTDPPKDTSLSDTVPDAPSAPVTVDVVKEAVVASVEKQTVVPPLEADPVTTTTEKIAESSVEKEAVENSEEKAEEIIPSEEVLTPAEIPKSEESEVTEKPSETVNAPPVETAKVVAAPPAGVSEVIAEPAVVEVAASQTPAASEASVASEAPAVSEVPADNEASAASEAPAPSSETAEAPGKPEEIIPVPVEAAAVEIVSSLASAVPAVATENPEGVEIPVAGVEALKLGEAPVIAPESEKVIDQSVRAPVSPVSEPTPVAIAAKEPTPEVVAAKSEPVSDSPPLANTPSKEEISGAPAAKSEERRKPAGKLQLRPPHAVDPALTPDSELEDAASLAQAIIASELRTPTVTSPTPPALSPSQLPAADSRLSVQEPDAPTPPVVAVSLSQIGVKSKPSTAAQIESSVKADSPKPSDVPKVQAANADATKANASVAEATVVKAPVTKAPVADAPLADAPVADAAKVDTPKTGAPITDASKAPVPKADAPKGDAPKADAPKADAPKKKVIKKVLKKDKDGASSGEAPVPPPRKKEKKPKEK